MKRIAGILMIAVASFFAPACNSDKKDDRVDKKNEISVTEVPAAVKDSFAVTHSAATDIVWEDAHEGDTDTYKVKFKLNDKNMKAEYKKDGSLVKEGDDQ
jgi:hypothetical protein